MYTLGDFAMHVLVRKCEIETEKQRDAEECRCCYNACYYHLHESEEERKAGELCNGCAWMVYRLLVQPVLPPDMGKCLSICASTRRNDNQKAEEAR